jgi:branched-subunit amino acid transport protein
MPRQVVSSTDVRIVQRNNEDAARVIKDLETPQPEGSELEELPTRDSYTSRLLKYIPAEILALFLTLDTVMRSADQVSSALHWAIFIAGIPATVVYLHRVEKVRKRAQLVISAVAFAVWVFALPGPFGPLLWYRAYYASVLLPVYTFVTAVYEA